MIRLRGLNKSFSSGQHDLHVLRDIDLDIAAGEFVAVMGASGSGKSTLLNMIGLLDTFDSGQYHLDGRPMAGLSETSMSRVRNHTLGFVFQAFNLISFKNALENVALPLYYRGVSRAQRLAAALALLDRFGLGGWAGHLPDELSGGQKQRVAIARALAGKPKVLLADEPTGALDSTTSLDVMNIFREVNASGITIVMVTHSPEYAAMAGRIVTIRDGRVAAPHGNA